MKAHLFRFVLPIPLSLLYALTTFTLPANPIRSIRVVRHPNNPLITFDSSPTLGRNINGPSVIKAPHWLENQLGKYYMYFAHHQGKYIRLAYSDKLGGPWKVHEPGTLRLNQAKMMKGHIASPDVHVDDEKQLIHMYFHGPARDREGQWTGVASSDDGLKFAPSDQILGKFYFRVFRWRDHHYAVWKDWNSGWGGLSRSADGFSPFKERRNRFIKLMRHAALFRRGDHLHIFYSRKGDSPERIVMTTIDIRKDWREWSPSTPVEVLRPEMDYEGVDYPNLPSRYGSAIKVQQLRDPCIYEENGRVFMFYTVAGEMGIALAELRMGR